MLGETVSMTPCGHHFHTECLHKQFAAKTVKPFSCAICRTDMQQSLPEELQLKFVRSLSGSPQLSARLDNIGQRSGSEIVDLLVEMPADSRGSRRTQLLLTHYVLSEDQNEGNMQLSSMDRDNLHRMQREGQSVLGQEDNERIAEFVGLANAVNRNFREGQDHQRVSELDVPSFRDLSEFLIDSTPTTDSERFIEPSISSRVRSLWNSVFIYGHTRNRDSIQSPLRQTEIDRRLAHGVPRREDIDSMPWYRFGC